MGGGVGVKKKKKKLKRGLIPCLDISLWQDALFLNVVADMNHHFQKQSFSFNETGLDFGKEQRHSSLNAVP